MPLKRKSWMKRKKPWSSKGQWSAKKPNKFGAKKSKTPLFPDRTFDSKGEMLRAVALRLLEKAGEISDLQFQPVVHLSDAGVSYKPDFSYVEDGRLVYEDFKGVETERFKIVCKLWGSYGPGILRVTKRRPGSDTRFNVVKTIYPKTKQ